MSVVVCTVGRELLLETVDAVLAQDYPEFELIVIDNRPANGETQRLLADYTDPRLRVVAEEKPAISTARNRGIQEATGPVIAFTDDDARPDPDWLSGIVRRFADDPTNSIALVTGRVVSTEDPTSVQRWFEDAKIFDKGETVTSWTLTDRPELAGISEPGEQNAFFPYTAGQFGSGNNMAFSREALASIGGFDERLGTGTATRGGEDLDIYRTTVQQGWTVFYAPETVVRHYHRDNMADLRSQWYGYGTGLSASLTKSVEVAGGEDRPILPRQPFRQPAHLGLPLVGCTWKGRNGVQAVEGVLPVPRDVHDGTGIGQNEAVEVLRLTQREPRRRLRRLHPGR